MCISVNLLYNKSNKCQCETKLMNYKNLTVF